MNKNVYDYIKKDLEKLPQQSIEVAIKKVDDYICEVAELKGILYHLLQKKKLSQNNQKIIGKEMAIEFDKIIYIEY